MDLNSITQTFNSLWPTVLDVLARIVLAGIVFIFGMAIANFASKGVQAVCKSLGIDKAVADSDFGKTLEKSGYHITIGKVFGFIVKWLLVVPATLVISFDILGLDSMKDLLLGIINFVPQVIIAVIVLLVGFVIGDFVRNLVTGSTKMMNVKSATTLGNVARVAIIVFASLIALSQLGIGAQYLTILFSGFVIMIALAGGLAFGLGGKDAAAQAIQDMKNSLNK